MFNRQKEVKKIVNQIIEGYDPEKIIIFGSIANQKEKPNSDIDLAVIKKTKQSFAKRLKKIAEIVKTWEALDVLIYTPNEWENGLNEDNYFIKEITKTGRVLYEK